jgi:hypothetical protein
MPPADKFTIYRALHSEYTLYGEMTPGAELGLYEIVAKVSSRPISRLTGQLVWAGANVL